MTSVAWLGGVAVSEIKSLNGRIGTNKTEARAETLLCINYIHKSRCKPFFRQLLCFVNQWTMYIFLVWTFWDYEKCTLVIRLVSDPSVVSPLVRNWKSFLFLPLWSGEGSLSHLVMSQPWNGPFCWKFLCHVFLSWSHWCSQHPPRGRYMWCTSYSRTFFFSFYFCLNFILVFWVKVIWHASLNWLTQSLCPPGSCFLHSCVISHLPHTIYWWKLCWKGVCEMFLPNYACTLAIKCKFLLSVCRDYFK